MTAGNFFRALRHFQKFGSERASLDLTGKTVLLAGFSQADFIEPKVRTNRVLKPALFLLFFIMGTHGLFAQDAGAVGAPASLGGAEDDLSLSLTPSAQLALSTPDYPVTAGDVYTLAYLAGSQAVDYTITVDTSYRIRVSNLAVINAAGKTYNELKTQVELVVTTNYPMSGVQFVLKTPAVFKVYIRGEVRTAGEVSAWALARLSSLSGHVTSYGSIREVSVTSSSGVTKAYDLYKARRMGDMGQDPYLRPNDMVTFNRVERRVTVFGAVERPGIYQLLQGENLKELVDGYGNGFTAVADKARMVLIRHNSGESISGDRIILKEKDYLDDLVLYDLDSISIPAITELRPVMTVNREERRITLEGAVRRPGTYELMPEENLKDLIEVYGDGFTPVAETTRIGLTRFVNSQDKVGNRIYLPEEAVEGNFPLENYDVIDVPSTASGRPVLFVEGAVGVSEEGSLTASNRIMVRFEPGENYGPLVRRNINWFNAVSDTRNAYIIRGDEKIPLDLNLLLYNAESRSPYNLEPNDTLIIPFRQYFVTVSGAVVNPGRYPYIPDRNWEYYVALAGGFRKELNSSKKVTIWGAAGQKMGKSSNIIPETIINAETNSFLYHFNQTAPVITTIIGLILSSISIVMLAR
jgi:protein involved in polysaccharide export with SLBB domain